MHPILAAASGLWVSERRFWGDDAACAGTQTFVSPVVTLLLYVNWPAQGHPDERHVDAVLMPKEPLWAPATERRFHGRICRCLLLL